MDYIIRKCELKDIPGITETVTTSWKETYKGLILVGLFRPSYFI